MESASTPEPPSSVWGVPNLPARDTPSSRYIDIGEGSTWVIVLLVLALPVSWWR